MSRDDLSVRCRSLLAGSAEALGSSVLFGTLGRSRAVLGPHRPGDGRRDDSTDGVLLPDPLLNAKREPLRNDDLIAVEAEETAELTAAKAFWSTGQYTTKFEEGGYLVSVPDDAPLPLAAVDDRNVADAATVFALVGTGAREGERASVALVGAGLDGQVLTGDSDGLGRAACSVRRAVGGGAWMPLV